MFVNDRLVNASTVIKNFKMLGYAEYTYMAYKNILRIRSKICSITFNING